MSNNILILHTLLKYDCTMYTVNKIVQSIFFAYAKPSFGSLNPAVKKLIKKGYVSETEKITEGGKRLNPLSITNEGKNFLKQELLNIKYSNPSSFANSVSIALICKDVLETGEIEEFKNNILLQLKLYKKEITNKLETPYNTMNDYQKEITQTALLNAERLEAVCQKA